MTQRFLPILTLSLLAAAATRGETIVRIHKCVKGSPGSSSNLQAALERSISGLGSVEFLGEGAPCDHTGALLRDLGRLADKRYFLGLSNHYFAYLKNNGNLLNVEQIELKTEADARQIETLLANRQLAIVTQSGSTTYEFFRQGRLLIFLVAPYRGWTPETRALAESIRKNYEMAAAGR
jgi:hypothetical protein